MGEPAEVPWLEGESQSIRVLGFLVKSLRFSDPQSPLRKVGLGPRAVAGCCLPRHALGRTDTFLQWLSHQALLGPHVQPGLASPSFLSSQETQVPRKVWRGQGTR